MGFLRNIRLRRVGRDSSPRVRWLMNWAKTHSLPGASGVPVYDVVRAYLHGASNGTIWQRAKGLSFSFMMAVPPMFIFLFSLIAYLPFDGVQNELLFDLQGIIPERFYSPVANTINDVLGHRHKNLVSLGFVASALLAAMAMHGVLMSFNFANKTIERRPLWFRLMVCLLLVVLLFLLITLVITLLVGYRYLVKWLIVNQLFEPTPWKMFWVSSVRWVLLSFFALSVVSLIYYLAPMKKHHIRFFAPGSIMATVMFFIMTWLVQIYFNNFSSFNLLYGSIGTLMMAMMWIFMNCWVLLIGYEMNTSIIKCKSEGLQTTNYRERKERQRQRRLERKQRKLKQKNNTSTK